MIRLSTNTHPLLTEPILDILFKKQIHTITNFIETDIKKLIQLTNLKFKNILTIRKHIINKNSAVLKNGLDAFKEAISKNSLLQTGILNVDRILDGGLSTGHIYELCGLPATGKTQFCLTLTKNLVVNLKQQIYYVDTKGDFNAARMKIMLNAGQHDDNKSADIMMKILVIRIYTIYELINLLHHIKNEIKRGLNMKLIIIDSLPPLLSQFEDHTKSNGILNHFVNIMKFLACEYYLCFFITNILTTWYDGTFGENKMLSEKIGCSKFWQSVVNTRLKIVKNEENSEIFVIKSNQACLNKSCSVLISDKGMY